MSARNASAAAQQPASEPVAAIWQPLARPHDEIKIKIERDRSGAISYKARGRPENLVAAGIARAEWIGALPRGTKAPAQAPGGGYRWLNRGPKVKNWVIERCFPSLKAAQNMPGMPADIGAIALEEEFGASCVCLPSLRDALLRRYPGLSVEACEWRQYDDGSSGSTIHFSGPWGTLVRHGLAASTEREYKASDEFGAQRTGSNLGSDYSYVVIHSYDDDPKLWRGTFPTRKVEAEVQRLLKRASAKRV